MLLTLETAGLPQVSLRLLTIGALAITCIASYNYIRVLLLRRRLPPGPFPLPVIGNHFRIPYWQPWVKFEEWSREYANPMITIWLGSRPVIVLNDAWTASDLLEKRADVYSSRPRFVAMGELTGSATTNQATLVYGDKWRLHRKLTVNTNIPGMHCHVEFCPLTLAVALHRWQPRGARPSFVPGRRVKDINPGFPDRSG
jgi:hypothetical protein